MKGKTVYLAGPFAAKSMLRDAANVLMDTGLVINTRWLTADETAMNEIDGDPDFIASERHRFARMDLEDVFTSDILIHFTANYLCIDDDIKSFTGGRSVELGYALANRKTVISIGEAENIFHHYNQVEMVGSLNDAILYLRGIYHA